MKVVGRLLLVSFAAIVSAVCAGAVLVTLGLERLTQWFSGKAADDSFLAMIELFRQGLHLAQGLTLLPALLAIVVGEVVRIRSLSYYVIAAGIALVAVPFLARAGSADQLPPAVVWQVFATAGFAAGLVYWAIAGRKA